MKILITGAKGFVGRNLVENLKALRDGKNRTRPAIRVDGIYEYDLDSDPEQLKEYCREADFVFHLAGVNRPKDPAEFREGNFGFSSVQLAAGDASGPVRNELVRAQQARRGESLFCVRKADRRARLRLPVSESCRQMGSPELQFGGRHVLPQHRKRSADHGQRSVHRARTAVYRRSSGGVLRCARGPSAPRGLSGAGRNHRRRRLRRSDAAAGSDGRVLLCAGHA